MRSATLLISLIISHLATAGILHAQATQTTPGSPATAPRQDQPVANPLALRIMAGDWTASVEADGSGSIGCGSSLGNYAFFPAGTFSLDAILKSLKPPENHPQTSKEPGTYTLETATDATHAHQTTITETQPVTALFEEMRKAYKAGKAINKSSSLEALWKKQPPTTASSGWAD